LAHGIAWRSIVCVCPNCLALNCNGGFMKKVFIASGYNSWTNKDIIKAFTSENEAEKWIEGLTNPHINIIGYKSTIDLVNHLLKG
jgi:hypothetical protein